MAKVIGIVSLLLGGVAGVFGLIFYNTCTASVFGVCFQYGFRDVGFLVMIFGGVLFVVGIVPLAIPDRKPMLPPAISPGPYYPTPPTGYGFPPRAPSGVQQEEKFCPVCGSRYPAEYQVCPRDNSDLKSIN